MWLREEEADMVRGLQPDHILQRCLNRAWKMDRFGVRRRQKREGKLFAVLENVLPRPN